MTKTLLVMMAAMIAAGPGHCEKAAGETSEVSVRKVEEHVVVYTIYRGSYDGLGMAIGKLFGVIGKNKLRPAGPPSYAFLNNPKMVANEHRLTEIRIPVQKGALELAGTLGEMTDVKTMPAMEVAVAVKPEGMADPAPIYEKLVTWIYRNGYGIADTSYETYLTNTMSGDYSKMKSEIAFPVSPQFSQTKSKEITKPPSKTD